MTLVKRTLQGLCLLMLWPAALFGQGRAFMDVAGNAGEGQPITGNTTITISPGASQELEVWVVDDSASGPQIASYLLILQCTAQSGDSGSVDYVDNNPGVGGGDSIVIDTDHVDWVFSGSLAITPPVYNETCESNIFGVIYNIALGRPQDINLRFGNAPAYLASFAIEASNDACGTHTVVWNTEDNGGVPPLAALFASGGVEWFSGSMGKSVLFQDLDVHVGQPNDDCHDAIDLSESDTIQVPFDTFCSTVDGPQDCATGADTWYAYATPHACLGGLAVSAIAGDVVVYPGGGCPPATAGSCNPDPIANNGGEEWLIQVIGDETSGILHIECACANDADCDDGNSCTDDSCSPEQVCTTTPNSAPCEDGDPCTTGEVCSDGACPVGNPIDCSAFDDPCNMGVCNPATGTCQAQPFNENIPCDDGNPCTLDDACSSGLCAGGIPVDCGLFDDDCNVGVCDPETGSCGPVPTVGNTCDDGDPCTEDDICTSDGACTGTAILGCVEGATVPAMGQWAMAILCLLLVAGLIINGNHIATGRRAEGQR